MKRNINIRVQFNVNEKRGTNIARLHSPNTR